MQTVRYDDGTGDELPVSLGTTAFVSGTNMFEILPPELKSLAVRAKVRYAPHPYGKSLPLRLVNITLSIDTHSLDDTEQGYVHWLRHRK